jgi:hypothetical protein
MTIQEKLRKATHAYNMVFRVSQNVPAALRAFERVMGEQS